MSFQIDNPSGNIFTITNNDPTNPIVYTIAVLGDSGVFTNITNYVSITLLANLSVSIDLINDGIYKITIGGSDYYEIANNNLRICEKGFLQKILCGSCESCTNDCRELKIQLRFKTLKERFYYIANKYRQDQSIVDLITPDSGEILYWSDILKQLTRICDTCNGTNLKCLDC